MLGKYKQGCSNLGCRVCKFAPFSLINQNFHKFSIETKIFKIGQHLSKLRNYNNFMKNLWKKKLVFANF